MHNFRTILGWILLSLVGLATLVGVFSLLQMRYERGDVYPPYSSLRVDPLGTKALYESLRATGAVNVTRNMRSPVSDPPDSASTWLLLGLATDAEFSSEEIRAFNNFMKNGGRFVIALNGRKEVSQRRNSRSEDGELPPEQEDQEGEDLEEKPVPAEFMRFGTENMLRDWGVELETVRLSGTAEESAPLVMASKMSTATQLNRDIPVRSHYRFKIETDEEWSVIYAQTENDAAPVLLQRKFGKGTLVLSAGAYVFSNEALRYDRRSGFLTWILGNERAVVFDEYYHDVRRARNVAQMIREYQLYWVLFGALGLAILYIWASVYTLIPRNETTTGDTSDRNEIISGRTSVDGLISLLRRSIKQNELLNAAAELWRGSFPSVSPDADQQLNDELDKHKHGTQDAVTTCRNIARRLEERDATWKHRYRT